MMAAVLKASGRIARTAAFARDTQRVSQSSLARANDRAEGRGALPLGAPAFAAGAQLAAEAPLPEVGGVFRLVAVIRARSFLSPASANAGGSISPSSSLSRTSLSGINPTSHMNSLLPRPKDGSRNLLNVGRIGPELSEFSEGKTHDSVCGSVHFGQRNRGIA